MYVSPTSTRLLIGMFTPAIRAISTLLPLSLLVARVRADHQDRATAANDLALLAHRLNRSSYLQKFRSLFREPAVRPAFMTVGVSEVAQYSREDSGSPRSWAAEPIRKHAQRGRQGAV